MGHKTSSARRTRAGCTCGITMTITIMMMATTMVQYVSQIIDTSLLLPSSSRGTDTDQTNNKNLGENRPEQNSLTASREKQTKPSKTHCVSTLEWLRTPRSKQTIPVSLRLLTADESASQQADISPGSTHTRIRLQSDTEAQLPRQHSACCCGGSFTGRSRGPIWGGRGRVVRWCRLTKQRRGLPKRTAEATRRVGGELLWMIDRSKPTVADTRCRYSSALIPLSLLSICLSLCSCVRSSQE